MAITRKHWNKLERPRLEKLSSLLQTLVNYGGKKLYNIGPRTSETKKKRFSEKVHLESFEIDRFKISSTSSQELKALMPAENIQRSATVPRLMAENHLTDRFSVEQKRILVDHLQDNLMTESYLRWPNAWLLMSVDQLVFDKMAWNEQQLSPRGMWVEKPHPYFNILEG